MTTNITIIDLDEHQSHHLEKMLRKHYEVVEFKILPNTQRLYDNDPVFRKILKSIKDGQLTRDRYINDHRE
jgi:hypothetical protein|tara:strand:+ start:7962 stop:8174 length:213 start_codon:yes stop_codon:yes gene_type:complete